MEERPYWTTEPPEVEAPEEPPLPTRSRVRAPWWRRPVVLAAAAGVVLVGAGVAVGISLGSHGSGTSPAGATDTSSQVHVWGSLAVTGFNFIDSQNPNNELNGDTCTAIGGYDDIAAGTAVVVGGPTGQVGVGALSAGTVSNGQCDFRFDVPAPPGLSVYTVTISHRGTQTFSPDQLQGGISLSIGS